MSKFDPKSPKGSGPNGQSKFLMRYAIRWFKCKLKPPNKKSVNRHKQLHDDKEYACSICGKTYQSKDRRYVHKRGAHGKGYMAYCGEKYKWPGKRQCHYIKGKCAICNRAIAAKKAVLKYTMPFKKEKDIKQEQ